MTKRQTKPQPTWAGVKAKVAGFDRAALLELVHDLYTAHKDNRSFLHARFGLGEDPLEPYKKTIDRWLWPDVLSNQDTSVSKAKQAVSDYTKAIGEPEGLAELMVFYCEQAAGFCDNYGNDDETYFGALVNMFDRAVNLVVTLPAPGREGFLARLDSVRKMGHNFGYGVGEDMDCLLSEYEGGDQDDRS